MLISVEPRIQSGVVPVYEGQVILVRSSNGKKWVFPKGGVEPDLDKRSSAAKEAFEEAGIAGTVGKKLGEFRYFKDKQLQIVHYYSMDVEELLHSYPEKHLRERILISFKKAKEMIEPDLKFLLKAAKKSQ